MARIEIDIPLLKSLLVLASVIEARDAFTGGHVWRTSRYARGLAESLGFGEGDVFLAQLGGLVHDLGKVGIPDAVLNKRGAYTDAEAAVMRRHPEIGEALLADHPLAALVAAPVVEHHLRPDGRGYPDAIADREPSIVSRVVTVADTFDAITSFRPYHPGGGVERAVAALEEGGGTQFDADFAAAFVTMVRRGDVDHVIGHAAEGVPMLSCPECGPIVAPPRGSHDGDSVVCPSCTGELVLHVAGDTFELEWTGRRVGMVARSPDLGAVDDLLADTPESIDTDDV